MSLFLNRDLGDTSTQLTPPRSRSYGTTTVSADNAMRSSAVWACVRLRADLISTLPLVTYRNVNGLDVEMAASGFLTDPAGDGFGITDWLYSSQTDLDRSGNTFGLITERDSLGLPAQVELQPISKVTVRGSGPRITSYKIAGSEYDPRDVWHERQFTVPGVPLGLSCVSYSAMSIGGYLSAQQFGLDWFQNGTIPGGALKNAAKDTITPKEAATAKERFKAATAARDVFVHGMDWEYTPIQTNAEESQFLQTMQYGVQDIARFFGVPGDLIDAPALSTAKITYANITQRHLALLVLNLGPAIIRREAALSRATPKPRRVHLHTDALMRLDPQTLATVLNSRVAARTLAPSEARATYNELPFTEEQYAEFDRLFAKPAPGGMNQGVTP